jgi:hypothetical protein
MKHVKKFNENQELIDINTLKYKGMIIDWLDGRHLQFETYEEAEKEYEKMLEDYKGEEIDLQLLEIKKELNNISTKYGY